MALGEWNRMEVLESGWILALAQLSHGEGEEE